MFAGFVFETFTHPHKDSDAMAKDPREQPLNDVARRIMVASNYDPHFSTLEDRTLMETRLFLARYDALCEWAGVDPITTLRLLNTPAVAVAMQPRWRHKVSRIIHTEVCRGAYDGIDLLKPGKPLVAYRDAAGTVWFTPENEFDNGQYEAMSPNGGT